MKSSAPGQNEASGTTEGHDPGTGSSTPTGDDDLIDEMVDESFPGSDPPSTWAGADQPSATSP